MPLPRLPERRQASRSNNAQSSQQSTTQPSSLHDVQQQLQQQLQGNPAFRRFLQQPDQLLSVLRDDKLLSDAAATNPELAALLDPSTLQQALSVLQADPASLLQQQQQEQGMPAPTVPRKALMQLQNYAMQLQQARATGRLPIQPQQQQQQLPVPPIGSTQAGPGAGVGGAGGSNSELWATMQQRLNKFQQRSSLLAGMPAGGTSPFQGVQQQQPQQQGLQQQQQGAQQHHPALQQQQQQPHNKLLDQATAAARAEATASGSSGSMSSPRAASSPGARLTRLTVPEGFTNSSSSNRVLSPLAAGSSPPDGFGLNSSGSSQCFSPGAAGAGGTGTLQRRSSSSLSHRLLRHSTTSPMDQPDLQRSGSHALNIERLASGDILVDITPPTRVTQDLAWSTDPAAAYVLEAASPNGTQLPLSTAAYAAPAAAPAYDAAAAAAVAAPEAAAAAAAPEEACSLPTGSASDAVAAAGGGGFRAAAAGAAADVAGSAGGAAAIATASGETSASRAAAAGQLAAELLPDVSLLPVPDVAGLQPLPAAPQAVSAAAAGAAAAPADDSAVAASSTADAGEGAAAVASTAIPTASGSATAAPAAAPAAAPVQGGIGEITAAPLPATAAAIPEEGHAKAAGSSGRGVRQQLQVKKQQLLSQASAATALQQRHQWGPQLRTQQQQQQQQQQQHQQHGSEQFSEVDLSDGPNVSAGAQQPLRTSWQQQQQYNNNNQQQQYNQQYQQQQQQYKQQQYNSQYQQQYSNQQQQHTDSAAATAAVGSLYGSSTGGAGVSGARVAGMLDARTYYESVAPSSWREPTDVGGDPGDYLELYRRAYCSYADALFPPVWLALVAALVLLQLLPLWQICLVGIATFWGGLWLMAIKWAGVPPAQLGLSRVSPVFTACLELLCTGAFFTQVLPVMWFGHSLVCALLAVSSCSMCVLHLAAYLQDPGFTPLPVLEEGVYASHLAAKGASYSSAQGSKHGSSANKAAAGEAAAGKQAPLLGSAQQQQQQQGWSDSSSNAAGPLMNGQPMDHCWTCRVKRNLRSKHCPLCRRCVERFDHHCPVLGNCVGAGNHKTFVAFLAVMLLSQLLFCQVTTDMLRQQYLSQGVLAMQRAVGLQYGSGSSSSDRGSSGVLLSRRAGVGQAAGLSVAAAKSSTAGAVGVGRRVAADVAAVGGAGSSVVSGQRVLDGTSNDTEGIKSGSGAGASQQQQSLPASTTETPATAAAPTADAGNTPAAVAADTGNAAWAADADPAAGSKAANSSGVWLTLRALWAAGSTHVGLLLLVMAQVPTMFMSGFLLFRALFLAAANLTVNEWINRQRYVHLHYTGAGFSNRFDRGVLANCYDFWCGPTFVDYWQAWDEAEEEMKRKGLTVLLPRSATVLIRFWDLKWAQYQERLMASRQRRRELKMQRQELQMQRRMQALGL